MLPYEPIPISSFEPSASAHPVPGILREHMPTVEFTGSSVYRSRKELVLAGTDVGGEEWRCTLKLINIDKHPHFINSC